MNEQDELLSDFLVETKENLDHLDAELLALEANPADRDMVNAIFRRLHTIKGVCGFLDLHKLEAVTHAGETLLQALRSEELEVDDQIITLLLTLCDAIRTIVRTIAATKAEGDEGYDGLREELLAAAKGRGASTPTEQLSLEEEFEAILAAQRVNASTALEKREEVNAVIPHSPQAALDRSTKQLGAGEAPATSDSQEASAPKATAQDTYLRVDVHLLDHLMNLAGELVLARNQILQTTKSVGDLQFRAIAQRLNLVTSELQEGVMKTRMQPINTVWGKFPRVVRDLSIACKKQVRLEMYGKETELDKTLIEAIKDPLTHIIRNSIDHGIETPDKRSAVGKQPEGCIEMNAYQEGGYVIIAIVDDGAGLNTEKIKERAVQRGLISRERAQSMSEAEVHRLIFAPGFSTADAVTNLSGRGVGMDVVKSSIEKIGGQVDISSKAGCGSTIRLKIPLTLAIIPALLLSCSGQRFAVPQSAIVELVQLASSGPSQALSWIGDFPFYRLRGELLPLLFLDKHLRGEGKITSESADGVILVIDVDGCRFGIVVDAVHDTEEIVVKPLGRQLNGVPIFAGASILGDGQIALIIDPVVLAREASIEQQKAELQSESTRAAEATTAHATEQLLIVQISSEIRAAIPLSQVKRLEEFRLQDIEQVGTSAVIQYRGNILPLVEVGAALRITGDRWSSGHVVVVAHGDSTIGIQVREILDVSNEVAALKPVQGKPGISAYGVIQGRVIALLDLDYLWQLSVSGVATTFSEEQPAL